MSNTINLAMPLLMSNQAQKEVTVNTALTIIDAITNRGVITRTLATPPSVVANGDLYIIADNPTGAWIGKANHIVFYQTNWQFIAPNEGMSLWVNDEDKSYTYDGNSWVSASGGSIDDLAGIDINNAQTNDLLQFDGSNFINKPDLTKPHLKNYTESLSAVTSNSGNLTLDLNNGNIFTVTLNENVTSFSISNPPDANKAGSLTLLLKQDATGGHIINWPANVKWSNSVEPSLSMGGNQIDILTFITIDNGNIWYGFLSGVNFS